MLLAASVSIGCGATDGPTRYKVTGQISYDGSPIPAGKIVFEPDDDRGNQGPAGYATIEDGTYATDTGKGVVGGPHDVRISGMDGVSIGESHQGTPLFSEFRTTVDLPKESTTHDFDVPGSHQ